jgi:DNA-binding transcriptional MerR regulator
MGIKALQIGQAARRTGLSVDAIRFYEKAGLMSRPARSSGGYRLYGEREIAELEFIQQAQRLGFSLNEIRELFAIRRHPDEACEQVRHLVVEKLAVVRGKLEELRALEKGLTSALTQCRKALRRPGRHPGSCPVLEEIAATKSKRKKS